ncbi:hypothetical protein LWI28_014100 [Acer negundo]|uniref:Uncharacterized protein n=1 Tax=Acer negundo TaxID=4023 RepID=A0AAD5J4A1_ACENE|nr:hypothetical protein LWI28_014100 [Acer negundo]
MVCGAVDESLATVLPSLSTSKHMDTQPSQTYGAIMSLKLGSITTIVISSPNVAKAALQKHDQALSSRTIPGGA